MESVNVALCEDDVLATAVVAADTAAAIADVCFVAVVIEDVGFAVVVTVLNDALTIETGLVIVAVVVAVDGLTTAVIEGFR